MAGRGGRQAQLEEHATLNLGVVSSSLMLGVKITKINKQINKISFKKKQCLIPRPL